MYIDNLRLLVDFGLVVLIWMVQLIVYPSFLYYPKAEFKVWHQKYMSRISIVVVPLILGQLLLAVLQFWESPNPYTIGSMVLIGAVWLSTFVQFAPVHTQISRDGYQQRQLELLVKRNWLRTALWTLIFLLNLMAVIAK